MLDFIGNMALRVSNWALQGVHGRMHDKEFLEKRLPAGRTARSGSCRLKGICTMTMNTILSPAKEL